MSSARDPRLRYPSLYHFQLPMPVRKQAVLPRALLSPQLVLTRILELQRKRTPARSRKNWPLARWIEGERYYVRLADEAAAREAGVRLL